MLETTWKTPTRLGRRPRRADHRAGATRRGHGSRRTRVRRPTTTPTTCSCAPSSASTAASRSSWSASRCSTTAATPATWALGRRSDATPPTRAAPARRAAAALRPRARDRGRPRARPPRARGRRPALLRALVGRRRSTAPADVDDADRADRRDDASSGAPGSAGARIPRPPLARARAALRARAQGPHLHADRRDGRRAHDVAARDARRRAQLGLPLHVDARRDLHAAGLHSLGLDWEADDFMQFVADVERNRRRLAADHVRDRRRARAARADARPPHRLRGRAARCGSATARSTSARTTSTARCSTRSYLHTRRSTATAAPPVADRRDAGRVRRRASGASPTRGSGRRAASRSTTCRPSSCAGSRSTGRASSPSSAATRASPTAWRAIADEIHADVLEHGVDATRRLRQHYDDRRARRLDAAGADSFGFLPGDDERLRGHRARDRRRADRERPRAALPHRRDRRRPLGQGGHVPDLLVLARLRAGRRRRAPARRATCGAAARGSPRRSGSTPRSSTSTPAATSATSRRPSPTSR